MSTLTRAGAVEHGLRGWPRGRPWGALKVILRGPWEFSGTSLRAPGGLLGILGVPLAGLVTSEGLWVWVIGDPESPWVARGEPHRITEKAMSTITCAGAGKRAPRGRPDGAHFSFWQTVAAKSMGLRRARRAQAEDRS